MNTEKYQGWTNYATWRVNLEIFSDSTFFDEEDHYDNLTDLSNWLKEYAEETVLYLQTQLFKDGSVENSLAKDYAKAFLNEVNYKEIAEALVEQYPHIIKKQ